MAGASGSVTSVTPDPGGAVRSTSSTCAALAVTAESTASASQRPSGDSLASWIHPLPRTRARSVPSARFLMTGSNVTPSRRLVR